MDTEDPIIYPIPLKGGRFAKLQLPRDMQKDEAEKIARIILAIGELPEEVSEWVGRRPGEAAAS